MPHSASLTRRLGGVLLGVSIAGCAANSTVAPTGASNQTNAIGNANIHYNELVAGGFKSPPQKSARQRAWVARDLLKHPGLIYWGNYDNSDITIYPEKGINPPSKGTIASGLSNPERLFVDKSLNVYATNVGNGTITAYHRGATSPFLTISNGVNRPTGLTVDAAGTVYCANVGNNTITEYAKGQTSPSLTISMGSDRPQWLAVDKAGDLYVSYLVGSTGSGVIEFAPGSTTGTNLGLTIGEAYALVVDSASNIIIIDHTGLTIDVFSPGQKQPSKQVAVTSGTPYALALNAAQTKLFVTVLSGTTAKFIIQNLPYPNGTTLANKITSPAGEWPIAVSPDLVL